MASARTGAKDGAFLRGMKVRIKELAQEAKFIRFEENKIKSKQKIRFNGYYSVDGKWLGDYQEFDKNSSDFWKLRSHRTYEVRNAARAAQLAYGFLRGVPYKSIESNAKGISSYDRKKLVDEVKRLAKKFGYQDFGNEIDDWMKELLTI